MSGCVSDCLSQCPADVSCCSGWNDYSDYVKCRSLVMAWDTMRALSGGRVTNCPVSMRPCLSNPCGACRGAWLGDWQPTGLLGLCRPSDCCCSAACQVTFPGEVASVCEVLVDGFRVDRAAYRLDDHHRLVRVDGDCWPCCQDLNRQPNEPNTMLVTYMPGVKPNTAGLWAVGTLACEYGKLCSGSTKCRLPTGITSLVRQGVTMQFNSEQFPGGLTGLPEVDSYITSINPNRHKMPPKVWSPDMASQRHVFAGA